MKTKLLTVIFLFICILCEDQMKSYTKNRFTLKAKMTQNLDSIADCGDLKLPTLVDFEIIELSDKSYKSKDIGIIIRCPEFYGKDFFEKGKIYSMEVEAEGNDKSGGDFDYSLQNMKATEKYINENIYW